MATRELSAWSDEGKPNRTDIAVAAFGMLWAVSFFYFIERISWTWLVSGFTAAVVAMGPVATSAIGRRISMWFENLGDEKRVLTIFLLVLGLGAIQIAIDVPQTPMANFAIGGMVALGIMVVSEAVRARVFG